jgi:hypothetical protein
LQFGDVAAATLRVHVRLPRVGMTEVTRLRRLFREQFGGRTMTEEEEEKLGEYAALMKVLEEHKGVWEDNEEFKAVVAKFAEMVEDIKALAKEIEEDDEWRRAVDDDLHQRSN